jgi:serine/threonine-protein kinase RsbT
VENEIRIPIRSEADIVAARQQGRILAEELGFNGSDLTVIATAISEVARNIVQYAISGEIILSSTRHEKRIGIQVVARDQGPGISDIAKAMEDGYSTGLGLGLGLPGARRLVDDFAIDSEIGKGTTITMKKWIRSDHAQGW